MGAYKMTNKDQNAYEAGSNPPNKVLYLNMVPFGLNMVVGKDMENLLGFGRAVWQAACAWQKSKDEEICAEFSQDAYARYRASRREYDDGQCDAANALADKIRSGE